MVKFRCPICTQKILVNDEAIGLVIACPNCSRDIPIPKSTDQEFQGQIVSLAAVNGTGPEALLPHLAQMMVDRLVQALVSQRRHLLEAQQLGTAEMAEIEQRLAHVHQNYQTQLHAHQQRIAELELQLARIRDENRHLVRQRLAVTQQAIEQQSRQAVAA